MLGGKHYTVDTARTQQSERNGSIHFTHCAREMVSHPMRARMYPLTTEVRYDYAHDADLILFERAKRISEIWSLHAPTRIRSEVYHDEDASNFEAFCGFKARIQSWYLRRLC